jgi:AraC-like DNA-binding protein
LSLRGPKLAQIFADLFDPSASQLEWDGWLLTFLIRLTADHAQAPLRSAPPPSARSEVQRARDYLRAHFADNVALAELAEIAGLSRFHLLRLFRAEFGVPPHAYQRMLRVEHAKRLLARGLPPGRVAAESGFFDQSHFGEHFRRMVGVTPSRYKALQQ